MRTRKLRLVSALLALAMMFVLLPTAAFAEDDTDPAKGKLLASGTEISDEYVTRYGKVYQMKGPYTKPIVVTASSDVTINITGDITYTGMKDPNGPFNYVVVADNANGNVTVNNSNYSIVAECVEDEWRGILYVKPNGHAVVNGGHYTSGASNPKETFYCWSNGTLTLNDVNVYGTLMVKNNGGTTTIHGGTYQRTGIETRKNITAAAISNETGGTMTLDSVDVYARDGAAVANSYGVLNITGGTFTSEDTDKGAIWNDTNAQEWYDKSSIHLDEDVRNIKISGSTIQNSKRGVNVKNENVILDDVAFKNNMVDIYLAADQKIAIADTFKGTATVDCADVKENRQITTASDKNNQKNFNLVSANDDYIIGYKENDDGTFCRCLEKRIGYLVTVINGIATTNDETSELDNLTQICKGTKVAVVANPANNGMRFNEWKIVDKNGALIATSKDEKFTFEMPDRDVTAEAVYQPIPETVEDDSGWDAGTVVTTAVLGTGMAVLAYHIGTEVYAEQVLGAGVAVPRTRGDVALKAWKLAGKPAVENAAVAPEEAAQAQQWVLESGLMENQKDGTFHPEKRMGKLKALRVLEKAQKMG